MFLTTDESYKKKNYFNFVNFFFFFATRDYENTLLVLKMIVQRNCIDTEKTKLLIGLTEVRQKGLNGSVSVRLTGRDHWGFMSSLELKNGSPGT